MWTETTEGRKFIEEVSKQIVTEVAPEELDLFDELIEGYFEDPAPPDLSEAGSDDPLGFGLGGALVAATPAAAAVVSTVLTYVLTEALKTFQEESAEAIKTKIKKLFKPEEEAEDEIAELTDEQLKQVRRLAIKQAKTFGMEADQAKRMADALIGALALAA